MDISTARLAELHAHTTFSDGSLTPEELVGKAIAIGLAALAVTDHDIIAGVAPARRVAEGHDLEIVAGLEFSAELDGHEIHVLGLFVDDENERLIAATHDARGFRKTRAEAIVDRLSGLGVHVDFAQVEATTAGGSLGRPHIAQAIVDINAAKTLDEAFRRYIGVGRPAFVPKPTLSSVEVIDVVHAAGGVAILAHPASSRVDDDTIERLADHGLDGFEVRHPKHNAKAERRLRALIEKTGMLPSGGSDFHGPRRGRTALGAKAVPLDWLEALREAAATHRNAAVSAKDTT